MHEGHAAHPRLAHQFDSLEQQNQSTVLGMWIFLMTEVMFFGAAFLGYSIYRFQYPAAFGEASAHLDMALGTVNTVVLLSSSLTMALAVHAAQLAQKKPLIRYLAATILLGGVFLGIKAVEYHHKFAEHLVPGPHFEFHGHAGKGVELFYSFYFAMTGLHAFHMVIGIGLLSWLMAMSAKGRFSREYNAPVEICGLYWHFVDIVWVFLYPLLYLIDRVL